MTEALPIGNGPMGAMLFGGTEVERIQFNDISLWSGTRMAVEGLDDEGQDLGAYQAFGDILIHLGHDFAKVANYRRELDIDRAVHQVSYEYNGVRYQHTAFASHPDGVIIIHLTADKPAACTGRIQLADMHQARIAADGNKISSVGKLENGFEYEAQLLVLNQNGAIAVKNDDACAKNPWNIVVPATSLAFDQCDSVTLILGAGTNFLQDHAQQWLGVHPHAAVTKRVDAAARQSVAKLQARLEREFAPAAHRTLSALLGVLYALMQHDIKRLLAYHSIENVGIIFMGLGVAIIGSLLSAAAVLDAGFEVPLVDPLRRVGPRLRCGGGPSSPYPVISSGSCR